MLAIDPRLGVKKGSKQSRATSTITANQAIRGLGGLGGSGGMPSGRLGVRHRHAGD